MSSSAIVYPSASFTPFTCHCSGSSSSDLLQHFNFPQLPLPSAFDIVLLISVFNLFAYTRLQTLKDIQAACLILRTQQAVKTLLFLIFSHTFKTLYTGSPWSASSSVLNTASTTYTATVCVVALFSTYAVVSCWPTALTLDPRAFPLGRPVEFYEFGVEEASVLPSYVLMHFHARGMKTEQWRLVL